jgi:hypothetical protein
MKRQSAPVVQECSIGPTKMVSNKKKKISYRCRPLSDHISHTKEGVFFHLYIHLRRVTQRNGLVHQRADLACRTEFK